MSNYDRDEMDIDPHVHHAQLRREQTMKTEIDITEPHEELKALTGKGKWQEHEAFMRATEDIAKALVETVKERQMDDYEARIMIAAALRRQYGVGFEAGKASAA